jgi:hypothetical protein
MSIDSLILEILNGQSIEDAISEAMTAEQRANLRRRAKAMKIRSGLLRGRREKTSSFSSRVSKTVNDYIRSGAKRVAHTAADAISNDPDLQKKLDRFTRKARKSMEQEINRKALETSLAFGKASIPGVAGAAIGGALGYAKHRRQLKKHGKPARTAKEKKLRRKQAAKSAAAGSLIGGGIGGALGGAYMYRRYLKNLKGS